MAELDDQAKAAAEKVRENKARRAASRQGLKLVKSRRRDPRAIDYGTYALVDLNNVIVYGAVNHFEASLDDIEAYLRGE